MLSLFKCCKAIAIQVFILYSILSAKDAHFLLVTELAPRAQPEWFEVLNTGSVPIDISGWRAASQRDTVSILQGQIGAGECVLLGSTPPVSGVPFVELDGTFVLNNYSDTFALLSTEGVVCRYSWESDTLPRWGDESLVIHGEGISLAVPTPGLFDNKSEVQSSWSLRHSQSYFFPGLGEAFNVEIKGPYGEGGLIAIFSIEGELLFQKRVHGSSTIEWDGCDRYGREVPRGPLLIELITDEDEHLRERAILWRE